MVKIPYEIPQNLKYVEKIAFGLTFWQLLWIGLFGGLAAIFFFKTSLGLTVKIVLALAFMGFGVGFAFLKFAEHLVNYKNYFFGLRTAGFFDKRLDEFVSVKKIENKAVYLKTGGLRAVLEVKPINFAILSSEEQKAIISAYKDFLNSLDFPVQIVMRTTSLNLDEYLLDLKKSVWKLNNPSLEKQFESFKQFVQDFVKENNVRNRLFYVIVPYSPSSNTQPLTDFFNVLKNLFLKNKKKTSFQINKELALHQLNIRAELCKEKLKRCGLFVERLNDKQLFSLLSSFFDSFIESENDYFFPVTMLEKFKEKGEA